ncbi:NPCBM/NEW2 domain-containing protein [Streptomyces sp. NPDC004610]|uniref:NPCBM/NEW2 domain-containing protein n=1 Tax=unclassified Streptomyces TaxID=2593676 RepID=UPI0033B31232
MRAVQLSAARSALRRKYRAMVAGCGAAGLALLGAVAPASAVQDSRAGQDIGSMAGKRTVVEVTDFGADPTGRADSAAAIAAAVEHAKSLRRPTTVHFAPGTYQIYPERTPKRELYVSNTVGADQRYRTKNIAILIEDMHDVVVDGGGATLLAHGYQTLFAAIRSTDVRFTHFTQDWVAPKTVDITVTETGVTDDGAYRVISVPGTYTYSVEGTSVRWSGERSPVTGEPYWTGLDSFDYAQVYDPATDRTRRVGNPVFENVARITDLGGDRLRIEYRSGTRPTDQRQVYVMRETTRDTPGALFWESARVTVDHLRLGYLHGFGLVGQFSEDITVDSVDFRADRATGRVTSGFADHIQMSGVKGTVRITDSRFDNPQDDPINIHGTYLQVSAVSADRRTLTLRYQHDQTSGFPQFYPGDRLELVSRSTMLAVPGTTATVESVDGPSGRGVPAGADPETHLRTMTVTVDRPVPAAVAAAPGDHAAENITYTPAVEISGNTFRAVPTRGILVTTRGPVRIEDNRFDGMTMSSIYISSDARSWYESGPVRDVVIRRNVFDRPASPVIAFDPTNEVTVPGRPVHRNVLIEDNLFRLTSGTLVSGRGVGDLTFRDNTVRRYDRLRLTGPDRPLYVGATATLGTDAPPASSTDPLFTFSGADDITLTGNTYADGFNRRVDTDRMPVTEVTARDSLALNADRITSAPVTVTYTSSHPSVATVDRAGRLTATGTGRTTVTAHARIDGERVRSNSLTVQVGPAPDAPTGRPWVSDLPFVGETANGWGPVERDRSNGEQSARDGRPLTLGTTTYAKGLGVHAPSSAAVHLGAACTRFTATVGIDAEAAPYGKVVFEVWADGQRRWQSPPLGGSDPAVPAEVDLTGATTLRLVVTDGGDGSGYDHADWADARLDCAPAA